MRFEELRSRNRQNHLLLFRDREAQELVVRQIESWLTRPAAEVADARGS